MEAGRHARAGSFPGIMAHTISYGAFNLVTINGQRFGEPDFFIRHAAEMGVPVGLVTGDQVVAEQVQAIAPWVTAVIVKQALARQAGRCIPPARAQAMIRDGAAEAVARAAAGALEVFSGDTGPYEIEVEMRADPPEPLLRNIESLPEFRFDEPRTIVTSADTMNLAFRRVAYLGYANQPGVTKY